MKTIDRVLNGIDREKHIRLRGRLRGQFHEMNMYSRNQIKAQIVKAFIDLIDIDQVFKTKVNININDWFEWANIKLIKQLTNEDRQQALFNIDGSKRERLYRAIPNRD